MLHLYHNVINHYKSVTILKLIHYVFQIKARVDLPQPCWTTALVVGVGVETTMAYPLGPLSGWVRSSGHLRLRPPAHTRRPHCQGHPHCRDRPFCQGRPLSPPPPPAPAATGEQTLGSPCRQLLRIFDIQSPILSTTHLVLVAKMFTSHTTFRGMTSPSEALLDAISL